MSKPNGIQADHQHHHNARPPKALLMGCGLLVVFAVLATGFVALTGIGSTRDLGGAATASVSLTFADREDGAVIASHAGTGDVLQIWEPGTGGFVRTALRALAYDRRAVGIGSTPPFLLSRTDRGRLLLEDPSTGKRLALEAFGRANMGEFEALLSTQGGSL